MSQLKDLNVPNIPFLAGQTRRPGVRSVCIVQVICVKSTYGEGTLDSPVRTITEYFTAAGERLSIHDPHIGAEGE